MKTIPGFDADVLHGITFENCRPEVPDFRELERRLYAVAKDADFLEGGGDLASSLDDIARDYGFGAHLEEYVDDLRGSFEELHGGIRDAYWKLADQDFEALSRKEMIDLLISTMEGIEGYTPSGDSFKSLMDRGLFNRSLKEKMMTFSFLGQSFLFCTKYDHYMGKIRGREELGPLEIGLYPEGKIKLGLNWKPSVLMFNSQGLHRGVEINTHSPLGDFNIPLREFESYFVDWLRPTEEEISLFDVVHPGMDWQVIRYIRDLDKDIRLGIVH